MYCKSLWVRAKGPPPRTQCFIGSLQVDVKDWNGKAWLDLCFRTDLTRVWICS